MTDTPLLAMPFIEAAQAQKHVTHNEALRVLDAVVQLAVLDRDLGAPPETPADGDRYLVAAAASGAWDGRDGAIAVWQDGAWAFLVPRAGWLIWVADEDRLLVYDGTSWGAPPLQDVPLLGVGAAADPTNRLVVASPATLLTHDSAGHRLKVNKSAPGDTASLLFQTGFAARAELGATGDDDFHLKVSPDGAAFHEALAVDRNSGETRFEQPVALKQYALASLPAPSPSARLIYVHDAPGGATIAYADGGSWRRVDDNSAL